MAKRVQKFDLSEHTLDINIRKCNYEKFDFSVVREYVEALTGSRYYQYEAIKSIMIYLWGGSYKDITHLAKESWKTKPGIKERFQSEENFLIHLPLPDRLSGVVHMATGTGKSYVMFAIAYLSIILGRVKKVLVLGPPSTVIEAGLTGKFREHLNGKTGLMLKKKLPQKYQNIHINLLNENDPIVDNSIVIENINSIYNKDRNSIGDTLFWGTDEVLVLSDEVHHAYSHLSYSGSGLTLEEGGKGDIRDERLWMKFIREEEKIKRHIGFTGTPYNQDEYFCDVIYNYSIKTAMDEKVIKHINPIIRTESDEGDIELTTAQKYEQILITHEENKEKYSYKNREGKALLKPITIFINDKQVRAQRNEREFIEALADFLRDSNKEYAMLPESQLRQIASEKVICVISKPTDKDYQEKLDSIEETNPEKVGGKVEFVFAVNKLSEGWDVDNVYQIVPMEERVFNSKLLISQVLGRGLRLPRNVPHALVMQNYPTVTVTNHEKFADHIRELMDAVTMCETRFTSQVFDSEAYDRYKHHFNLFNLEYNPIPKLIDSDKKDSEPYNRELILTPSKDKLGLNVTYLSGEKRFELKKNYYTVDQVSVETSDRFSNIITEGKRFDFGSSIDCENLSSYEYIENIILAAMDKAGIEGRKLSEQNKKAIELYFNQFLPRGTKRRVMVQIEGDIKPTSTKEMDSTSTTFGNVGNQKSIFISEDYLTELNEENLFVIKGLDRKAKNHGDQLSFDDIGLIPDDHIRKLFSMYRLYVVNTSLFKTPQNMVIVSHDPEREFVFKLIKSSKYIDSWIKSRDMWFYSLDYEYWKGGKDRTRRSFNPDFFIKLNLDNYIMKINGQAAKNVNRLFELQDKGIKEVILVVEIKSDDDQEEVTRAKEKAGKEHFAAVNKRLESINSFDLPEEYRNSTSQYYIFGLLRPDSYNIWFENLKTGRLKVNF